MTMTRSTSRGIETGIESRQWTAATGSGHVAAGLVERPRCGARGCRCACQSIRRRCPGTAGYLVVGQHALRQGWTPSAAMRAPRTRPLRQARSKLRLGRLVTAAGASTTRANMSSPRHAIWPSTVARTLHLQRPGPCTLGVIPASSRSVSPGFTTRLKRTLSMPANRPILPWGNRAAGGRADGRRLRQGLDDEDAGHDRVAREVPGEQKVVGAQRTQRHAAHARVPVR